MQVTILSAVAVPVYLNQRGRAYDAAAKSDLRQLAALEQLYLADHGRYGSGVELNSPLGTVDRSDGVTLKVWSYEAAVGYCLSAEHDATERAWYYDSQAGGMLGPGQKCSTAYAVVDKRPIKDKATTK